MKVIIPTNFSKSAQNIVDFICKTFGSDATYLLLNSFQMNYKSSINNSIHGFASNKDEVYERKMKMEELRLKEKFAYPNIRIESAYGDVIDSLWKLAKKEDAHLVVMNYSSFSLWKQEFENRWDVPLVFVPDHLEVASSQAIYYITDFSNTVDAHGLALVKKLALNSQSHIRLFCLEEQTSDKDIEKWSMDQELLDVEHDFEYVPNWQEGTKKIMQELETSLVRLFVIDFKKLNNDFFQGIERKIKRKTLVKPMLILPAL